MPAAALEISMSSFGESRKAQFDVAVAIVDLHLAPAFSTENVVAVGAQVQVSGRVRNLKIAGAGFRWPLSCVSVRWSLGLKRTPFATLVRG